MKRTTPPQSHGFSLLYFLYFGAIGLLQPYLYLFLRHRGLSESAIGVAMLLGPLAVLASLPVWGSLADLSGNPKRVIQAASLGAGGFCLLFLLPVNPLFYMVLIPVFYGFEYAVEPVVNSSLLNRETDRQYSGTYGNRRRWGSAGFVVGTLLGGWLTDPLGLRVLFPAFALAMVLVAGAAFRLGSVEWVQPDLVEVRQGVSEALSRPRMLVFLVYLVVWGIAFTGNFIAFSWFWEGRGGSAAGLGLAWALAAVLEIPLYGGTVRYFDRIDPGLLLLISPLTAALRWCFYLVLPELWMLYFVQPLHALMFVSFSVGSVYMMERLADPSIRSTGQTLIGAAVFGLGAALGNGFVGLIYDAFGAAVYYQSLVALSLLASVLALVLKVRGRE